MRAQLLAAVRILVALTVLCGFLYPLAVTAIGQLAFADDADGSLVERDGVVVGSELIGQSFTAPQYFHSRPSAAGAAAAGALPAEDPFDLSVSASGASNLGPTNEKLLSTVADRVQEYREANGLDPDEAVPVDAVTASGSGLDPQISIANARLQAARVARERDLPLALVGQLIDDHTDSRALGFLGEPGVNVLLLNLALDERDT